MYSSCTVEYPAYKNKKKEKTPRSLLTRQNTRNYAAYMFLHFVRHVLDALEPLT